MDATIYARIDSATGKGMNEGWLFGDGEAYFREDRDALEYALDMGYESLEDAVDDDAGYYTEWEDVDEYQYIEIDGNLFEIDLLGKA